MSHAARRGARDATYEAPLNQSQTHTKCIIPAAVNHTDIKIETNCAKRMELDVLRIFKY